LRRRLGALPPRGGGGHIVHEVGRPDRRLRRRHGRTDPLDAEAAARAVPGGQAGALPEAGTGEAEMVRHLEVARDAAVKARTRAMPAPKALVLGAPAALRERLEATGGKAALVRPPATLRPGPSATTTASAEAGLRAVARRWLDLDAEIGARDAHLVRPTGRRAPRVVAAHGMGAATAAEPRCPSRSATTRGGSAPGPPSPSPAAPARSRPRVARPAGTA
jgi:hypothetical protein